MTISKISFADFNYSVDFTCFFVIVHRLKRFFEGFSCEKGGLDWIGNDRWKCSFIDCHAERHLADMSEYMIKVPNGGQNCSIGSIS